jgi:hypothetical protein
MRRIGLGVAMAAVFACLALPGIAQAPEVMDLAQLKLEVVKTERVDGLWDPVGGVSLKAKEGAKIVVVTLGGTAARPVVIVADTKQFAALYYKGTGNDKRLEIAMSDAISLGKGAGPWAIASEGKSKMIISDAIGPGPVTLRVGLVIPDEVNSFLVLYPTFARGKAVISTTSGPAE